MSLKITPLDRSAPRTVSVGGDLVPQRTESRQNAPKIDLNAPRSVPTPAPAPTLPWEGQEAPISDSSAKGTSEASDPRMLELLRKEMLIREEARRVKAEKEALDAARAAKPETQGMTAEQWKQAFLEDPTKVGLDLEQIADRYLNAPKPEDARISQFESKIAQLEATIQQNNQRLEQAQKQAYENAKKQFHTEAQRLAGTHPDKYEAVAADSAYDAVVALIESTYQEENVLLSVEDAMQKVEDYLTERALKYAGLKKVRAKVETSQGSPAHQEQKTLTTPQTQARSAQSLTHSMAQSSRTLTPAERIERAKRIARGERP